MEFVRVLPANNDIFFGAVTDMDVQSDGSVVVLDGLSHNLLIFGPEGDLKHTLGRKGQGPGEIGGAAEFELTPAGNIALVGYRNLRISSWDREGQPLGSVPLRDPLGGQTFWPHEFVWTTDGPYLKISRFIPTEPGQVLKLGG